MRHTQHPTNNGVLGAPPGTSYEQCTALPVTHALYGDGTNCCMSFWEPSAEERAAIANGAKVVLSVWGTTHAPVSVGVAGVDWAKNF